MAHTHTHVCVCVKACMATDIIFNPWTCQASGQARQTEVLTSPNKSLGRYIYLYIGAWPLHGVGVGPRAWPKVWPKARSTATEMGGHGHGHGHEHEHRSFGIGLGSDPSTCAHVVADRAGRTYVSSPRGPTVPAEPLHRSYQDRVVSRLVSALVRRDGTTCENTR